MQHSRSRWPEEELIMFDNAETQTIIEKKLLPALEELARAEFGVYSMVGNIDDQTISWMIKSKDNIERLAETYIDGLLGAHIAYGAQLQKLRSNLNNGRD